MDVGAWLRGLGLERYADAFRAAEIDAAVLPRLTDEHLKELGLPLGSRLKLLDAIAELNDAPASPPASAAPPPKSGAERRQLTVMFVDLVGSTALSTRLDPEDLRELIGAYHRRVAATVEREGGFVAKYMGDGVLAYFGYPRAHEDDAERAIRAGLALVTAAGDLEGPAGTALRVRVGVATGLVVVGDLLGSGASREEAVVGETPNLAARLQALAEPDSVVIAAGTRRLVGDLFECADLGEVEAKGFAAPVRAYRVLGVGAAESRFEAFHAAALAPLVGREEEIDLLLRRWRQARSGEGRVVLLAGEPGVGKSRLLAALQERLGEEPHVRLRHSCSPHHQDSALHPVTVQLERAAGFARGDPPEVRLGKLEALLAPTSPPAEDVALLAELLSVPVGDRYATPPLAPQRKRELTFAALLRRLERLSARVPVLIVFEDVHWIDPSSRELLDLVVERAAGLPALLLVTFRPGFEPPWTGQPHVAALTLDPLGPREAAALVRRIAGGAALADDLVAEVVERTDGVPLFVEELTKAVLEAGAAGATGTVAATPPVAPAVPATLHASLVARLDRLGPAAREVAQVGAAIGREFPHELLAAVAGRNEAGLAGALDQLAGAGLVTRRGVPPGASYVFKHALVQDVAYGMLLRDRRRRLHGRIARALEEQRSPELAETAPEVVAHHFTQAGAPAEAAEYWLEAGRLAGARSANAEAVAHLTRGLELLRELPSDTDRERRELRFACLLGPALNATRGYSATETVRAYEQARELIARTGDAEPRDVVLHGLYLAYYNQAEFEKAFAVARECLREAAARDDATLLCIGHRLVAASYHVTGDFPAALSHARQALAFHDAERHEPLAWRFAHDLGVAATAVAAYALCETGFPDQAAALSRRALARAAGLNHPNTIGFALFYGETLNALKRRDFEAVGEHAARLEAHGREHKLPRWVAWGMCMQGAALAVTGRADAAVERLGEGIAACDRMQNRAFRPTFFAALAEAHAALGRTGEAIRAVADGLAIAERTGERWMGPELHRLRGEFLLRSRDGDEPDAAEGCFRRAIERATRQGARLQELRAATALARLRRDHGRRAEARDLLAPVYGWFTEGFDTPDLRDAKMLLDELR